MAMDLSRSESEDLRTVVYLMKWRLKKLVMFAVNCEDNEIETDDRNGNTRQVKLNKG
jgi:hypothetical protein